MRVVSLASGSGGNATVVEQGGEALLIDCGISGRELVRRCEQAAVDPSRLVAVLVTHNHGDHVKGLGSLRKRFPSVSLFANLLTAGAIAAEEKMPPAEDFFCFENGQDFEVGPFAVHPFSIPHDTVDPVGYVIRGDETYFHGTDIGTPLDSIGVHLRSADLATLESNHDPVMLRTSGRPPCLIQRIAGPRGHLSNDQASDLVRRFASPRLRRLALAHLSEACNTPHLSAQRMRETLDEIGRGDVSLKVFAPSAPVEL